MSSDNTTTIDGLPLADTPLSGGEEVPLWQSGATKKVTVTNLRGASGTGTVAQGHLDLDQLQQPNGLLLTITALHDISQLGLNHDI